MLINGHHVHFEQYGPENGPAVVLLHHGLGSVKAWQAQIPDLTTAGYRVIACDRWGYGGSDAREGLDLPTFEADVDDLVQILDKLGIRHAALVGHSDGGTLALYFAAQQSDIVKCLICIAAHIYVEPKMEEGIQWVRQAFESDEHFQRGLYNAHGDKYETVFWNWYNGWNRMGNLDWEMNPILHQIMCPTLIIQGDEDEHATLKHAKDIADQICGSELWLVHEVGHMLPQKIPAIFNARIIEFINRYMKVLE